MNGAEALCEREGEGLRRALAVAFADDVLAALCTAEAFARAHRRWRALAARPDPMAWVDVVAVQRARRALAAEERNWQPPIDGDALARLRPRARVAVVLHSLRGRGLDEVAAALGTTTVDTSALLRDAYRDLGVVDADIGDETMPYAR
jgi:hypothetical protein